MTATVPVTDPAPAAPRTPLDPLWWHPLREPFVRGRFEEHDRFRMAGIEAFLWQQRVSHEPRVRDWDALLELGEFCNIAEGRAVQLLTRDGVAISLAHIRETEGNDALIANLQAADRERSRIYEVSRHTYAVVTHLPGDGVVCYTISGSPGGRCEVNDGVDPRCLPTLLLRSWASGQTPHALQARQALCDRLEAVIAAERAAAENDFDSAVSVSPAGNKILHADWVWVIDERKLGALAHLTRACFWYRRKIRLAENYFRFDSDQTPEPSKQCLQSSLDLNDHPLCQLGVTFDQIFLATPRRGGIFFTLRAHCPNPLPPATWTRTIKLIGA